MRSRRIAALITVVALWAFGPQALASGLIGSVSGVNEGEDVRSANQGQLTAEESYDNALGAPTDGAQTGADPATGATIDLGIGETTVSPQTTAGVDATGDAGRRHHINSARWSRSCISACRALCRPRAGMCSSSARARWPW